MAICKDWRPLSRLRDSVSLRLGHGAALTCPRHVIHYRAAASLPKRGAEGDGTEAVPYDYVYSAHFLFSSVLVSNPATPQSANGRQLP